MDCQHLRRLLQQAKFKSLFRELSELALSHDPDLSEQYTSLSARFNRYQRERHLMDTRDFETAQNRLIRDLSQFLDDLCEESEKITNSSPPADAKTALFDLIDENRFDEVFAQVKASSYRYDKAIFSRLERQFAFQVTLDLVDQLKVFVGSLR